MQTELLHDAEPVGEGAGTTANSWHTAESKCCSMHADRSTLAITYKVCIMHVR